jgi:uncharacterized membrane protein
MSLIVVAFILLPGTIFITSTIQVVAVVGAVLVLIVIVTIVILIVVVVIIVVIMFCSPWGPQRPQDYAICTLLSTTRTVSTATLVLFV